MDFELVFALVSAGLLAYALYQVWKIVEILLRRSASGSWPKAIGNVISKDVSVNRARRGQFYDPRIVYSYSVMGEQYQRTISLGTRWWESSADKAINEIGNTLEVRYNPEKPKVHISDQEKIRIYDLIPVLMILIVALIFVSGSLSLLFR